MKLYYKHPEWAPDDEDGMGEETVEMTWAKEEEDIWELLERLKTFTRAIGYGEGLVKKIHYLTDDQIAKLHLLGEAEDLQD